VRIVVYGAGAIGGVLGARLHQNGADVVLIARGPHYEAIRHGGLRVDTPVDSTVVPVAVVDHPGALEWRPDDVVVLAMKTQDVENALKALEAAGAGDIPVACAQNGVESERLALRRVEAVYGVCVMAPAAHLRPGVVQAHSVPTPGILDVGRYPDGGDEVASALAASFRTATFAAEARTDIMAWKYTKLLMNVGNAVEALCPPSEAAGDLVRRARREAIAAYRAAAVEWIPDDVFVERRGDLIRPQPIGDEPRSGGSSWQSLARGTGHIEADYLNGEISLLGRLHGVPTPVNDMLRGAANEAARLGRPPGSLGAEELLARITNLR
jgi:2-dehydropantoate 2-reductase